MHASRALSPLALTLLGVSASAAPQFVLAEDSANLGIDDVAISPDGTRAVARENTVLTSARVYDLATGAQLAHLFSSTGTVTGFAQDGVACSNERAIVIGSSALLLDLGSLAAPLAEYDVGDRPRDVEITATGTIAAVRGGSGPQGGNYLFDMTTGSQIGFSPGQPRPYVIDGAFDVDSVAIGIDQAIFTSWVSTPGGDRTRVTIWDLHFPPSGQPMLVYESSGSEDQLGLPYDVTVTPDGGYAAVRSELSVGLYDLIPSGALQLWNRRLAGDPGPFGLSAMDSIEASNDRIATISRWSNGGFGTQVSVFDLAGAQKHDRLLGDPHDLAITPSGARLVVRTHLGVYLYDIANLPAGDQLVPLDEAAFPGTHTSYGAGLDSVAVTDERAVTLSRVQGTTEIALWDISADTLALLRQVTMPERPTDVAITPDGTKAVVTGLTRAWVLDLRTGDTLLDHDPEPGGLWPWCDGVVANDATAVAFGLTSVSGTGTDDGWLTTIDLFDEPSSYCSALPNSTGAPGTIFAVGSPRVGANDLGLRAIDLPPERVAYFLYGQTQASTPFGDGILCVGGPSFRLRTTTTGPEGVARQDVDYATLPAGGAIQPGSTWNFQLVHRDRRAGALAGVNLTDAVAITFEN